MPGNDTIVQLHGGGWAGWGWASADGIGRDVAAPSSRPILQPVKKIILIVALIALGTIVAKKARQT